MARIKPQALLNQSKKKKGPTRISLTTIIFCNLFIVFIILSLVITYRWYSAQSQRSRNVEEKGVSDHEDVDKVAGARKFDIPSYAILDTSKGSITVEFFKEAAPETIDKFIKLCRKGHFKGMLFRHVIKNYIIQAGYFQKLGAADDWTLKKPQNQHFMSPNHDAFMLGTSKAIHNNEGFDLFITIAPIPDLNDKLVVFGQVIKGQNVVQEIEEVDTDKQYQPKSPVEIINVTLRPES